MITLYHVGESRSMRTLWLLNELGVPFRVHDLPWDLKFLRAKDYLAVEIPAGCERLATSETACSGTLLLFRLPRKAVRSATSA